MKRGSGRTKKATGGMVRAALYLRRSTEEHQEASLAVQEEEARRFIQNQGWTLSDENVFVDSGVSRAEFQKRPGLVRLINAAEDREFDVVVTRDETRLGGDMIRTGLLVQSLVDAGTKLYFYFTGEEVRCDDATSKFILAAKNFAAELEREKISQRTHEHLLTKARKGFNVGGRVYGYDNVEVAEGGVRQHVEYRVNEEEAAIVRDIFERYAKGQGLKSIVRSLNDRGLPPPRAGKRGTGSWSQSAVWAMLRRPRYVGKFEWNHREKMYRKGTKVRALRDEDEWIGVEVPHLRIIEQDLWAQVQQRIEANKHGTKSTGRPPSYLLTGVTRCAECGGPLTAVSSRSNETAIKAYGCAYYSGRGTAVCTNALRRPVDSMNDAVASWIAEDVLDDEMVAEVLGRVEARLKEEMKGKTVDVTDLETQLAEARAEADNLVKSLAKTAPEHADTLLIGLKAREEKKKMLVEQIARVRKGPEALAADAALARETARAYLMDLRRAFEDPRSPKARALVTAIFPDGITATPVRTSQGNFYRLTGEAVVGEMFVEDLGFGAAAPQNQGKSVLQKQSVPRGIFTFFEQATWPRLKLKIDE